MRSANSHWSAGLSAVRSTLVRRAGNLCNADMFYFIESSFIEFVSRKGIFTNLIGNAQISTLPQSKWQTEVWRKVEIVVCGFRHPGKRSFPRWRGEIGSSGGVGRGWLEDAGIWCLLMATRTWPSVCFPGGPRSSWHLFCRCLKQDSVTTCNSSLCFSCMLQNQARQRHVCLVKLRCYKEFSQFQLGNKRVICKGWSGLESSLGGILK